MSNEINPDAPEDFEAGVHHLVNILKSELGNGYSYWYYDESSETLYIELESLEKYSEKEIQQKAGPILDASELDFEEIVLLPLAK